LLATLVSASLLGGCGFMNRHFERKNDDYKRAVESRPLEVPPDLDTPNSSGALSVPAASARTTAAATSTTPPPGTAPTSVPPEVSATPGATISGDGLTVSDTVANTWSRVGLALERSGVATITGRDEAGHTYAVETTGRTTTKAGWFKRAITFGHAGNKTTARVQLNVRINADGAGSRVSIEGADDEASRDAARSLLNSLRERLS
jgi:uncharacterized lipoprotein